MKRAAALIGALGLLACDGATVTEIVLVVDTDIEAADGFAVTATFPDGEAESTADFATQDPPRTLVLAHRGGPLGPVRLRVAATEAGAELTALERVVTFEEGRSLTLHVFLSMECRPGACPEPSTCADDGTCRDPVVLPCEYEGRSCDDTDGGVAPTDGAPLDAEGCRIGGTVCGVAGTLLPGDRIAPVPCSGGPAATTTVTGPSGEIVADGGAFAVVEPGAHVVRLSDGPDCTIERTVQVAGPSLFAHAGGAPGELRDLAARVGLAFVAGDTGAWAVERMGWVDLRASTTGTVAPADLGAVAVHTGQPVFGPANDVGAVYRVVVDDLAGPFAHEEIDIDPTGVDRSVKDMAVPLFGGGALVVATPGGLVGVDLPAVGGPSVDPIDDFDATWVAVGAERPVDRGEVWMGRTGDLANARLDSGPEFDDGQTNSAPPGLVELHAAVVDDRDPTTPRLWLCGDGGVGMYRLDEYDWSTLTEMPIPDVHWSAMPCAHLAVGPDGHAWVATGGNTLVRLGPDASEVLRYGSLQALGSRLELTRVAVAWDGARREVWGLDAAAGEVILFAADQL